MLRKHRDELVAAFAAALDECILVSEDNAQVANAPATGVAFDVTCSFADTPTEVRSKVVLDLSKDISVQLSKAKACEVGSTG